MHEHYYERYYEFLGNLNKHNPHNDR